MKKNQNLILPVCLLAGALFTPSINAQLTYSIEPAGDFTSTVPGAITENFSEFSPAAGTGSPVTSSSVLGGAATLTGGTVFQQDQYGGTGTPGNFYLVGSQGSAPYAPSGTLTFNTDQPYFGMWWSAADQGGGGQQNTVVITLKDGTTVTYTTSSLEAADTALTASPYLGNPVGTGTYSGDDTGEPFFYINFNDSTDPIASVEFENGSATGFEMDNFAINGPAGVPDMPGTISLLGLGLSGLAAFGRRFRK